MDIKLLEEAGFTEGESKVYLALVKLGSTKTGPLAKEATVSSSKVYKILDRLETKGIVGHVIKGKVKFYNPLNPNRILDYISEKEKELVEKKEEIKKAMPSLDILFKKAGEKNETSLLEGFKGVTNMFRDMIDELKQGEEYYVLGATYGEVPGLREFFYNHHRTRARKKIKLKMLANYEIKNNIEQTTRLNAEIRFLPQYLATNMEIVFYKNKAFIVIWSKSPSGFLIENEEAVKSFRKYFDALWKIARK